MPFEVHCKDGRILTFDVPECWFGTDRIFFGLRLSHETSVPIADIERIKRGKSTIWRMSDLKEK